MINGWLILLFHYYSLSYMVFPSRFRCIVNVGIVRFGSPYAFYNAVPLQPIMYYISQIKKRFVIQTDLMD